VSYKRKEVIGNCTLYLGDNKDVMQDIDLSVVGACVTDPPFGINVLSIYKNRGKKYSNSKTFTRNYKNTGEWDKKPADIKFILDLNIPSIIWGGNYFNVPPNSCWLVWDKINGKNCFADCELAWTNFKKPVRKINLLWNGMLVTKTETDNRQHPTQKPIQLMKWCIEQLPKDCTGAILDPFMGVASTGVACAKMGRSFIGIELDEEYFNIACRRVEDAYKQGDLFI
jgi:site-specific DNA-methyltransferase (adenine-specific)/modification methylase